MAQTAVSASATMRKEEAAGPPSAAGVAGADDKAQPKRAYEVKGRLNTDSLYLKVCACKVSRRRPLASILLDRRLSCDVCAGAG
jgi:hypothetical protein